ncbi:MAG: branched-chain amino acid ABC transporter permease [Polaromonas sp.]|nr:branched-chain amino acid ABC transporter permease [Polaromonas sp.]
MDLTIAALLTQDGVITGAVYALLAMGIVLVFSITRVIFVPQGDYVAYAALTMAAMQAGKTPGIIWLLLIISGVASLMEIISLVQEKNFGGIPKGLTKYLGIPLLLVAITYFLIPIKLPIYLQVGLTLALVTCMGPLLYRVAFRPVAGASVLVLLIISVAVHLALTGFGLIIFGAEGSRTTPYSDARFNVGPLQITGQSIWVLSATIIAIAALYLFFKYTVRGKALQATAINRVGAQLMGIRSNEAGSQAFLLSAMIGGLSGLLIAPITTIFYDTGFLIGLKGFVAAIVGGLFSYPLAAVGALLVGLIESFSSFWASAFKEVFVFTLILPVLLWRSLRSHHSEEDDE